VLESASDVDGEARSRSGTDRKHPRERRKPRRLAGLQGHFSCEHSVARRVDTHDRDIRPACRSSVAARTHPVLVLKRRHVPRVR
jgi:hypothetical protein